MNTHEILNILMVLFSSRIAELYLSVFQNQRKSSTKKQWLAWSIYIFFQYWVMMSNASQPLFTLIINIILIFGVYKSSYHVNNRAAAFCSVIFYAIWMLVEVMVSNILNLTGIIEYSYFFMVGSIVSKIVMYIIVHILKSYKKSNTFSDVSLYYWLKLLLIPIATFYIIHCTYCITSQNDDNTFFTITAILLVLVNYITFDVYDKLGNLTETQKKNIVYEQQIALCNRQASERENAYQETRRIRHDLNGYLLDLKATLQTNNIQEAKEKIDCILEKNRIYKNEIARSGNIVIDSLINYKYAYAQNAGINMKCYVFAPEQLPFDGADLCIILGNIIDNAIEAVAKLPSIQRHIDVSVSLIKGSFSIIVCNPYKGQIKVNSTGYILTGKTDPQNHGIGLGSVQRAVDKYNGEMLIDYANNIFRVSILLYPPENLHKKP